MIRTDEGLTREMLASLTLYGEAFVHCYQILVPTKRFGRMFFTNFCDVVLVSDSHFIIFESYWSSLMN